MKLIPILILFLLCGCESRWDGFFYPNGVGGKVERSPTFKSKKVCIDWCLQKARSAPNPDAADYECGKNCKSSNSGLFICEDTVDTY